jgi:hypothetical protein
MITMTVNTAGRPGKLKKTVEVWTNDPANKMVILSSTGEVVGKPAQEGDGGCAGD